MNFHNVGSASPFAGIHVLKPSNDPKPSVAFIVNGYGFVVMASI